MTFIPKNPKEPLHNLFFLVNSYQILVMEKPCVPDGAAKTWWSLSPWVTLWDRDPKICVELTEQVGNTLWLHWVTEI